MGSKYLQAISASFGVFALGAALAATAAPRVTMPPTAPELRVGYVDLDLSSEAGRAELSARVRDAASALCGGQSFDWLAATPAERDCLRWALADASTQIRDAVANPGAGQGEGFITVSVHR